MRVIRALALIGGVIVPGVETWRRWGNVVWWPVLLDDWLIGIMLLAAWWLTRRGFDARGRAWMAGAWGVACGIAYCSFFTHLHAYVGGQETEIIGPRDISGFSHALVVTLKGIALAVAAGALAATLVSAPSASPTTATPRAA